MSAHERQSWRDHLAAVAFETAAGGPHEPSTWHAVAEAVEEEVVEALLSDLLQFERFVPQMSLQAAVAVSQVMRMYIASDKWRKVPGHE